jgi:Tubulin-tyrosine ligase family
MPEKYKNLFHVIGVDVILDKDCKPHLLEINANPSINILFDNSERFESTEKAKVFYFFAYKYIKVFLIIKKMLVRTKDQTSSKSD